MAAWDEAEVDVSVLGCTGAAFDERSTHVRSASRLESSDPWRIRCAVELEYKARGMPTDDRYSRCCWDCR